MGVIYKITNNINGKVYIGLTTTDIKRRWNHHKTVARNAIKNDHNHPLYNSMLKYGIENFKIEEIDSSEDFKKLGELERKYIKEYKSSDRKFGYNITMGGESNQLDANPRAKLTVEDVKNIRKIYNECKIGCKEAWGLYSDKISFSAFEKIYEGITWKSIMSEVYTDKNKLEHKKMTANRGEKNGNSILSDEKVYEIRKYYVNHTLRECYDKYGAKFSDIKTFRRVIDSSYTNIPRYSKVRKEWFYESDNKRVNKSNNIRVIGDVIEIDTFDDYGNINGTFITDYEYINVVKKHKWNNMNGKIYTTNNKRPVFLHNIIIGDNRRTYYVDNNSYNVRKNNLIHNFTEYKIFDFGIDKFKEYCLDEKISLRKISKIINASLTSILKFVKENNIKLSENKIRNKK